MKEIIKILNDYDYDVVFDLGGIILQNNESDNCLYYAVDNKHITTYVSVDIYIMEKFIQLITEFEKE